MIANLRTLEDKILDLKYKRIKTGLGIGNEQIDQYLRLKPADYVIAYGHSNVGKTTILIYLFVLWAIKHEWRFLIWSSENTAESIARRIIEFKKQKPIDKMTDVEISEALSWCNNYFKIIDVNDMYTFKDVLDEAKAIKDAWNYQGLLIDPYNSLANDKDLLKVYGKHEYDYYVSSEFRLFAKKYNITLFLNAHGVTEALRRLEKNGEYEGLPAPLNQASIEGGGKWSNRADLCLGLHRYTTHATDWMYSFIRVEKVKEIETGGRPTPHHQPIKLRMMPNNVGFEFCGKNLMGENKHIEELEF